MRTFAALIVSTVAVAAQEIGFTGSANVASGTSAINNPNVNNGWQADSSLFASGDSSAPNTFNGVFNSHFTNINSNLAASDNLLNNPSFIRVAGNNGWSANGDHNAMGPVQNNFGGAFVRRGGDVVFANGYHGAGPVVSLPPIVFHSTPAPYNVPIAVPAPAHYEAPIVVIPKPVPAPIIYSPPPATYAAPPVVVPKPAQYVAPPPVSAPAPASYAAVSYQKAEQKSAIVPIKA
ncbi:hypothetical protein H4S07_000050 [Coemansia furcata]|uniref:Uncharacterized protein n=1 Tax=Coemansia furcata TaxID=417177 RepID=A0ACC1LSK0_9FUNG|nr:hypothetical protein H4S07_000050 [Coemansia furcata]